MDAVSGPENEMGRAAFELAGSQVLLSAVEPQSDIYAKLSELTGWLDRLRTYCLDAPAVHSRAADWLLDNDYQVLRAIRQVQSGLPEHFFGRLDVVQSNSGVIRPRIFDIAHSISAVDGIQISMRNLVQYLNAFQEKDGLSIAELWAFPSALRLASLEMLAVAFFRLDEDLSFPFRVDEPDETTDPADLVARSIINLGAIHSIRWQDFVDQTSLVEAVLTSDPARVYRRMEFSSRDTYRKVIEKTAAHSSLDEVEVARCAVKLSSPFEDDDPRKHVGYWLEGAGLAELETLAASRVPAIERIGRKLQFLKGGLYAASLVTVAVLALCVPVYYLYLVSAPPWAWILATALSFIPASVLSVSLVHWAITQLVRPRQLPAFDFSKGIPDEYATTVIVPVIVTKPDEILAIVSRLETRRLANPDKNLRYVLLSDLCDADHERLDSDDAIEQGLVSAFHDLNRRHGQAGYEPFVLMHRHRVYNTGNGRWMGWERKRGKLEQFNRFVLGDPSTAFSVSVGSLEALRQNRYVITLDADTMLPPGAAAQLVGTLAHPLNRAVVDERSGQVLSGYSILQPRMEMFPSVGSETLFSHLYSGDAAIDIYTRAVSDVYQDMFGSGSFVGKGIYDVKVLQGRLENRIPENAILSHDLFEGLLGRTALVTNIVLYESFPSTYAEYVLRLHRWVRGDWQLLPWLRRRVPMADGTRANNPFSLLDRWKIIDNLRRSLVPPALLLFFIGGWMVLPGSAVLWTLLAVAAPGTYLLGELFSGLSRALKRGFAGELLHRLRENSGRWFLAITFLVSDTLISIDAIVRTVWRVGISQQNLLEWRSAAHTAEWVSSHSPRSAIWKLMWPSSALSVVLFAVLILFHHHALSAATPLLVLWLLAPEIAIWTSKTRRIRREALDQRQSGFLLRIARRTWHFFEMFAGPEDNWLPPDNYQDAPRSATAHRTSPTNIGLYMVSALSARDFGFITTDDFASRCRNVHSTLDRMQTYRGHLLNWYDTRSLEPLEPRYVSTVDSGNLAISLLAVKNGCRQIIDSPVMDGSLWRGLDCVLDLLEEAAGRLSAWESGNCERSLSAVRSQIALATGSMDEWLPALERLDGFWPELENAIGGAIEASTSTTASDLEEIRVWVERFEHHLRALRRAMGIYLPWLGKLETAPEQYSALARQIRGCLDPSSAIGEARSKSIQCLELIDGLSDEDQADEWLRGLRLAIEHGLQRQELLQFSLEDICDLCDEKSYGMNFAFLYDPEVRLFRIGYNLSSGQMDTSHYDLLATEARLASFFAIAKHDAPIEHWFYLGRPITRLRGKPSILSWNGSMFEYLMPPLFLPGKRDTLLGESEATAIEYQRHYAKRRGVPWGISESAFAVTDADGNYQYRAFGAPGLGIRRGLTSDLVIAPYASALALCIWPNAAVKNLRLFEQLGVLGIHGFVEALDYTPDRADAHGGYVPVNTYMAHHQGMILAAIANVLGKDILVRHVLSERRLQAVEYLLQEKVPWTVSTEPGRADEIWSQPEEPKSLPGPASWIPTRTGTVPQFHHIGNGHMSMRISDAGGGGLSLNGTSLTRWQPDPTRDHYGYWIYVQDEESGSIWSVGRRPAGRDADEERVVFHQHMVEMMRRADRLTVRMEATVAPSDNVEIRQVTVTNEDEVDRSILLTSYAEVVLSPPRDDERHPAFSKLFVHSSYNARKRCLLFERRPRRPTDSPPVLLHTIAGDEADFDIVSYETDRRSFLGRCPDGDRPEALRSGCSRSTGWTLDPVMSMQVRLRLKPMQTRSFSFVTVSAKSARAAMDIADKYRTRDFGWVFRDASRTYSREYRRLEIDSQKAPQLQALSSLLAQNCPALRRAPGSITSNRFGQPDLWQFGISGDLPILLIKIEDEEGFDLVDLLVRAQQLWRRGGLEADIAILRIGSSGYEEPVRERILSVLRDAHAYGFLGRNGGVHLISASHIDPKRRFALEASASVVLEPEKLSLEEALDAVLESRAPPPRFEPAVPIRFITPRQLQRPGGLEFDNGFGGFDKDNGEYVVFLEPGERTPAPWCNVLANDTFGTIVSESGLGFSWAENSGENRLTSWSNDPVCDTPGEFLYLRDEASAEFWTVTAAPLGDKSACETRHGAGFTSYRQNNHALEQEMLVFVPKSDPVKIVRLRLNNLASETRRITATYFADLLLGAVGSSAKPHIACQYSPGCKAILANNAWNPEFASRVAFLTASLPPHSMSGDRYDFLGHEGDHANPAALRHMDLGGRFTAGGDVCAAYQVHLDIAPGETAEVCFVLGQGEDGTAAEALAGKWTSPAVVNGALEEIDDLWAKRFAVAFVETPDRAFDLMMNRWLPYQNMSSRYLARAGFYQAGGAFGYRDQLQDTLALLHSDPDLVRSHLLRAASHQFEEGDALHWWHPPSGRGVRTHCSDDYLWLPFVTARYVEATGDRSVLDEPVPFLTGPELRADQHDHYALFDVGDSASLYEHCKRALERMMPTGRHGLPLIGTGDWNDGMDRVGWKKKGESVWLAWFQIAIISHFVPIMRRRGDAAAATRLRDHAKKLKEAIGSSAWDGKWFLRAFDDDGEVWGSSSIDECRIDSIAQSWSVLSGGPISKKKVEAIGSAKKLLIDPQNRLVKLLDPPFENTTRDPGYIKAYPPGVRENGGQYTHAAAWLGLACAKLGDGDAAWQVFDIINPIRRADKREAADLYRREPYVLPGDVSALASREGQGGWSWYTGAAGWTWQLGMEGILGVRIESKAFTIDPSLPRQWRKARVVLNRPDGTVIVTIDDPQGVGHGVKWIKAGGRTVKGNKIGFPGPGRTLKVTVRLG